MAMHPCGTFDYVTVVPEDPAAYATGWQAASRQPVKGDRLVGHAPILRITDAEIAPDTPPPRRRPFARPEVLRSRITLTATEQDASHGVSFHVARDLTSALRPGDVLHLARTLGAGLGVSVIRGERLVAAAGAVDAVPLGDLKVGTPGDVIDELKAVLKRHDPTLDEERWVFYQTPVFRELPVEVCLDGQRRLRYWGRFELGEYDVDVIHGFLLGTPGDDLCVAITLRGACPAEAASASARLLDFKELTREDGPPREGHPEGAAELG